MVENAAADVQPERTVALELRFGERLIGRRRVGEGRICRRVAPDSGDFFGAVICRLDIENVAVLDDLGGLPGLDGFDSVDDLDGLGGFDNLDGLDGLDVSDRLDVIGLPVMDDANGVIRRVAGGPILLPCSPFFLVLSAA